jgi:hypothetical protein
LWIDRIDFHLLRMIDAALNVYVPARPHRLAASGPPTIALMKFGGKVYKLSLGLLIGLSLMTILVRAQLLTNPVQDYINKTTLLNNILSNQRAIEMSQKAQTKRKTTPPAGPNAAPSRAVPEATKFNHTGTVILPKLLAEKSQGGIAGQQSAEKFFVSLLDLYQQTARKDGFPSNDLAYAFNYFLVNTYMTFHDLHDVPYEKDPRVKRGKDMFDRLTIANEKKLLQVTSYQERAIYNQFKALLSENPAIQKLTDRDKQTLTELLAIMFGLDYMAYMKGVNSEDEKVTEQARQTAKMYLERITGAPVERIKIGNDGVQW